MKILLPFRSAELEYVVHVLFGHFLGLEFSIHYAPELRTVIRIELDDARWLELVVDRWLENPEYQADHLPKQVSRLTRSQNPFIPEDDLPILYGEPLISITDKVISLRADIVSSAFFMLSRWEEFAVPNRDSYGRFPASASFAIKNGFYQRPIVDEYVEMLWNFLKYLGIGQKRKVWKYDFIPTHDIDNPVKWRGVHTLIRTVGGDLLKRHSFPMAWRSWVSYWNNTIGEQKDPYDTFDYLMDLSEKSGAKSHFFFLCGGQTAYDEEALPPSHPIVKNIIQKIERRGHVIGFHPSFNAHTDEALFRAELESLQDQVKQHIRCGRQHYLRFEVPDTWRLWEAAGMEWESSLCYPEESGFRCGTCRPFPVFDILQRKALQINERPLLLMEGSWIRYNPKPPETFLADAKRLIDIVRKYKGEFVLLWHNSTLNTAEQPLAKYLYEEILAYGSSGAN